jgi:carbamoyltransferase
LLKGVTVYMTVILGFNAFHADSAACLVVDGKLLGAVAEEPLGERHKHRSAFPANAIRHLLVDADLRFRDVTHVAMARDPRANYAAKMTYAVSRPVKAAEAVFEHVRRNRQTKSTLEQLAWMCDEDPGRARSSAELCDSKPYSPARWQ